MNIILAMIIQPLPSGSHLRRQNGSVGGYMIKKMIEQQEKQMSGK